MTHPEPADDRPGSSRVPAPHVQAPPGQAGATGVRGTAPALPHTGDAQVDAALEGVLTVTSRPVEEQVEVYVGVHRKLQDRLADLDG